MRILLLLLVLYVARAHSAVPTSEELRDFFGPLEPSTVKDRKPKILDWQSCQCVPHYLCNMEYIGIHANNVTVTGSGLLDIRGGAPSCEESIDICCIIPKDSESTKPKEKPKGCGYRNTNGIKGINILVSGVVDREVYFGEFPWVVALQDQSNHTVGTGVLIHPQVVMTTALIVYKYPPGNLRAIAGEWDLKSTKKVQPFQEQDVQEILIHSDYNNGSLKNDVALLKLAKPFELAEHINVICLPNQDETFDGVCVANGWGMFDNQSQNAAILKKTNLDMVSHTRCNKLLKSQLGDKFELLNSFVCAQGKKGKDICQGDGGAPLVCPFGQNRYKLTGLAAWNVACGQKDTPGVYANVPMFRQWIDNQLAVWGYNISS